MIVYNVTTKVDHSIAVLWLNWMKQEHIPEIIATGCFTHATILHMIETDETDGLTYAVQYHAESKALYNRYIKDFATALSNKATSKWGNKYIAFRSVLQIVN
ncbi:DUF4286 family protein [Terrimonas rubra]|uniref:DUF4286 family protein n=1 Tax=Terrimonas rubra TaxID=1035890 RepID=A0ABW6A1T6_9BACT